MSLLQCAWCESCYKARSIVSLPSLLIACAQAFSSAKKGLTVPRLADPVNKKDVEYYMSERNRGYLALRSAATRKADVQAEEEAQGGIREVVPEEDIVATRYEKQNSVGA